LDAIAFKATARPNLVSSSVFSPNMGVCPGVVLSIYIVYSI
jgi:hypothetical protein